MGAVLRALRCNLEILHGSGSIKNIHQEFMEDRNPYTITEAEWREIAAVPEVRDAWGMDEDADPLELASYIYGARFNFISGSPGYVGDIYVLQGDALSDVGPMVLRRDSNGRLIVC
jgi:hypothetical protein